IELSLGEVPGGAENAHEAGRILFWFHLIRSIEARLERKRLACSARNPDTSGLRSSHYFGSTCPPNFLRIADNIFSANVCSCRDRNRVYSAALKTSAGTASSIA